MSSLPLRIWENVGRLLDFRTSNAVFKKCANQSNVSIHQNSACCFEETVSKLILNIVILDYTLKK